MRRMIKRKKIKRKKKMTLQKFSKIFLVFSLLLFLIAKLPIKVLNQQLTNKLEVNIDKYNELYDNVEQLKSKVGFLESNDRVMEIVEKSNKGKNLQIREENVIIVDNSN